MSVPKCKVCGAYNGIAQWPPEERPCYTPDKCLECTQKEIDELADTNGESCPEDDSLEAQREEDDSQEQDPEEEEGDES